MPRFVSLFVKLIQWKFLKLMSERKSPGQTV